MFDFGGVFGGLFKPVFKPKITVNATVEVICYKSKVLNNGNHPLMLRVTKDRKTKYISLGISIPSKEWDFTKNQPKPNCSNKEHIEKIILTKKTQYNSKIIEFTANKKNTPRKFLLML